MPSIYVQDPINEDALAELRGRVNVIVGFGDDGVPIDAVIGDIDGLLVRTRVLDANTIEAADRLRVIARYGVGCDNIDVGAATRRGVPVLIAPHANSESVAEHVFSLLLAVRRRTIACDRLVRTGRFHERDSELLHDLAGSTLGIIGLGRIGREVARIARDGFRMEVIGYDPWLQDALAGEPQAADVPPLEGRLDAVLSRSDAVTLHIPRTPETVGLIGRSEFLTMPAHAVLINTARGGIVDESALADALADGQIAGAGIDVLEQEPPEVDHPLFDLETVVLSPHNAGLTHRSTRRVGMAAAQGILDVLDGVPVETTDRDWLAVNGRDLQRHGQPG